MEILVLILAVGLLMKGKGGSGSRRPKIKPQPGPGNKGDIWAPPGGDVVVPEDFDFGGNQIYLDPECEYVIEGNLFWPTDAFGIDAEQAPTVTATLNVSPTNTIVGWLDYMIDVQGITDPYQIAAALVAELAPLCADVDESQWSDGFFAWHSSFVDRVTVYLEDQIDFGGQE